MEKIKSFWYQSKNVGDTLTPFIVEHFTGKKVEFAERNSTGKLISVGSIMKAIRVNDTIWGAGVMRKTDTFPMASRCEFLAVRGKLSEKILGIDIGVYGDPALLLPLMYNPKIEKTHTIGLIPHYIEKKDPVFKRLQTPKSIFIDVEQDWKSFVDQILSCSVVVSSSLHGCIIAEAYGITAHWLKVSDKVLGDGFKFADYLSGTGRELPQPSIPDRVNDFKAVYHFPELDREKLKEIQDNLLKVLYKKYGRSKKISMGKEMV